MKNRLQAFSIHLLLSAIIAVACILAVVFYWYPSIFHQIDDVFSLVKIIIPVDIILGPLITLLIYKKGKRGLAFDLVLISCVQISALLYGLQILYNNKPSYLVFHHGCFYVVPQKSTANEGSIFSKPQLVWFDTSSLSNEKRAQLALDSLSSGIPFHYQKAFYRPLDQIKTKELSKHAKTARELKNLIPNHTPNPNLLYFDVMGLNGLKVLAFNPETKLPAFVSAIDQND